MNIPSKHCEGYAKYEDFNKSPLLSCKNPQFAVKSTVMKLDLNEFHLKDKVFASFTKYPDRKLKSPADENLALVCTFHRMP